ncbi:uncharacterized protein M421DRAFT_243410 [Didymella exigua CBS 183.55]|uniref:Uncharacterized protein n=1 Tax=Didymella exigua CBS 183.55 TaxID=1150837 RepID=A0A6A5RB71_9PLEO|nr:uncharacterized protein M421DRAFT_243410 [Didymella exigua CBS 183.55]KAF1925485.1 hypothetical protein M421DRAFT_243410 [Didymella exigua CBS 183.55]
MSCWGFLVSANRAERKDSSAEIAQRPKLSSHTSQSVTVERRSGSRVVGGGLVLLPHVVEHLLPWLRHRDVIKTNPAASLGEQRYKQQQQQQQQQNTIHSLYTFALHTATQSLGRSPGGLRRLLARPEPHLGSLCACRNRGSRSCDVLAGLFKKRTCTER